MKSCCQAPHALGRAYLAPWAKPITTEPPWTKDAIVKEPAALPEPVKMEPPRPPQPKKPSMLKIDEGPLVRRKRAFPKAEEMEEAEPLLAPTTRTWPEAPRRLSAASYAAVEIHGFFGLIDDGSDMAGRVLIAHVPKWVRGYFLDIRQGDTLHVNRADGKMGGVLTVLSTGRHKYYSPGRKVSTCTILVPEEQWAPFGE